MESIPNNSESAQKEKQIEKREISKIEGTPARHRPTFWKMLKNSFGIDTMTPGEVVTNVVIPSIRDGLFDVLLGSIEYIRSGSGGYSHYDPRKGKRTNGIRTQMTDYRGISQGSPNRLSDDRRAQSLSGRSSYDDIFISDYRDEAGRFISGARRAQEVLSMCYEDIYKYNYCRVSDFLNHCNIPPSPNGSDYNWGWANLDDATYKTVKGGAIICMPTALQIED